MPDEEKVSGNRSANRPKLDEPRLDFQDVTRFELSSHLFSVALDDVCADAQAAGHRIWKQKAFYTKIAFANERLNSMALTNEEFQRIGETVVARLLALERRLE